MLAEVLASDCMFQSLFSWNLPLNRYNRMLQCVAERWFQSLFSWNLPLNSIEPSHVFGTAVSILVFVELALEYCNQRIDADSILVSILVFVELALEFRHLSGY